MANVDIRERLVVCAEEIEKSIAVQREEHAKNVFTKDIPFELMRDNNGVFLSASLYSQLGVIYAAIAQLDSIGFSYD